MLVQFRFKNFASFMEDTTFDLTAINAYKEHDSNLINSNLKDKFVKVAAIYGANASGKSNLALAMRCFQRIIIESMNNVEEKENLAISKFFIPFEFCKGKENTEFEIVQILDDYEYKYGFEYNENIIVSEWLYLKSYKTNRLTMIIERDSENIKFGSSIRKECEQYQMQIPCETLVLSFMNKLKLSTSIFFNIYSDITGMMIAESDYFERYEILKKYLPKLIDTKKDELMQFLSAIDVGIKDIQHDKVDDSVNIWSIHNDLNGDSYKLNLSKESEGTIKSIILFMYCSIAIRKNYTMFIDELNTKLHPLLLKFIIDLFYNKHSSAQLIYTTHDTTLLDRRFFRRDQIWFVEKDEVGRSKLIALSDYKVRSDSSFEKDYLAGVYGGIPQLNEYQPEGDE